MTRSVRTKRIAVALVIAMVLATGACRVKQPYQTPSAPQPPAFSEAPPASFEGSKEWQASSPADALRRGHWWEVFADPALTALEEKVDVSNESLKAAQARFDQARAFVRESRSAKYPTVTAGAAITRDRLSLNKPVSPGAANSHYADFTLPIDVSWEPDVWGRVRSLVLSAAQTAQVAAADVESVRLSLHAELALDYFDLRSADEQKRILDDAVTAYEKALALTRNRFEGGVANRVEMAEAETQLEATRAQAIDVGDQRAKFVHAIAVLTGQPPEGFTVAVRAGTLSPPVVPVGIPSALLQRRPDIAGAERRVAVANTQIGVARTAFYPQVLLGAALGLEGTSITNWMNWPSRFWAIGPSAVQTVFDAGRRRAVLAESTANYDALIAAYRQNVLSAFEEVEDGLSTLRVLEDEAARQSLAVAAARRSEELSMNRYRGGLVTYLEVVTAQGIRLQNERVAQDVARRRMEAAVLLIKALGGGWDAASLPRAEQFL